MPKLSIVAGATSQSVNIFIQDSSKTDGSGLSGLAYNTSGLIAYYTFTGTNAGSTAITLATLTNVNSAYSSGGFKEIDATNMKGLYRLDIPNAALATSKGQSVTLMLGGATNMAPVVLEVELTGWNNQDAVHGGMSALPNAAAEASGGLYTRGSGAGQINQSTNGQIDVDVKKINSVATSSVTTVNANQGTTQPVNFTGTAGSALVKSDMVDIAGAAVSTTTAQIGVNAVQINAVSTASVTTVNANQGTTQPVNFTGTAGSALVKSDMVDIAGAAVSPTSAQIGVNVVQINTVATSSVTTVNANQGTTQPVNFTGTAGSALVKCDTIDINGISTSAVTTINANIGTTQPVNFTGTGASALAKSDAIDINSVSAAAVTTINANIGTTQPVNFTGTGASALAKSDAIDINSVSAAAVTTINANIGTTQPVNFTGTGGSALVQVDLNGAVSELSGVPASNAGMQTDVKFLAMKLRNKETSTASAATIANNAGTTIATSVLSDNGTTFTKNKYA